MERKQYQESGEDLKLEQEMVDGIEYEVMDGNGEEQDIKTILAKLFAKRMNEIEGRTYNPGRFRTFEGVKKDFLTFVIQNMGRTTRLPERRKNTRNVHVMNQVYEVSREKSTPKVAEQFLNMTELLEARVPGYDVHVAFYYAGKYAMPAAVLTPQEE